MKKLSSFIICVFVILLTAGLEIKVNAQEESYEVNTSGVHATTTIIKPDEPKPENKYYDEYVLPTVKPIVTTVHSNIRYNFHYYIPEILKTRPSKYPLIVWIAGYNIDSTKSIPSGLYELANKHGYAIVSPNFMLDVTAPAKSVQIPSIGEYTKVFLNMLSDVRANGVNYSKIYIVGYAEGAEFASHIASNYPNITEACAILQPTKRVDVGKNYGVKYFLATGALDTPENISQTDFFIYNANKNNIAYIKKEYETDNKLISQEIMDVAAFFEKVRQKLL